MTESSTGREAYRSGKNVAFSHTVLDGQVTAIPLDAPALGFAYTYAPAGGVNSSVLGYGEVAEAASRTGDV